MLFSSPVFLFCFLPSVLLLYYALPQASWRNAVLLVSSLVFYFFGEGWATWVLIFTWLFTWSLGLWIGKSSALGKIWLCALGIVVLLGMLIYFKYWNFFGGQGNHHLPLGISFFVFQALSYIIDLKRGRIEPEPKLQRFALYKSFFPQLICGPIVRYAEIKGQLGERHVDLEQFIAGAKRFSFGLAKKSLLADSFARVSDPIWSLRSDELSAPLALAAMLTYGMQLYFDFSGYTDMACGLAGLFGFKFPENFDYPHRGTSVSDYWRRWHMTLSRWFRDYVYDSLGGSWRGPVRILLNLWVVFLLCGLWHGAAWHYVAWGTVNGLFLTMEHFKRRYDKKPWFPVWMGWIYTQVAFNIIFTFFRANSVAQALDMQAHLFKAAGLLAMPLGRYLQPEIFWISAIALPVSLGVWPVLRKRCQPSAAMAFATLEGGLAALCLGICAIHAAAGSYQSFIYFRF